MTHARRNRYIFATMVVLGLGAHSTDLAAQRSKADHAAPGGRADRETPSRADLAAQRSQKVARLEYQARAGRLAKDDVVAHFALAQWCAKKGLPRCQRWEVHVVLAANPDHVGARKMLGHVQHEGKWLPHDEAMRRKGRVFFAGKWRRKYDIARLRHAEKKKPKLTHPQFQHAANLLLVRLANRDPKIRKVALIGLTKLAADNDSADLLSLARKVHGDYERYWVRRAFAEAIRPVGVMSISLTKSDLVALRNHTTSLGTGSPVTIQLPTVKTVSINTTVVLPLGFGR